MSAGGDIWFDAYPLDGEEALTSWLRRAQPGPDAATSVREFVWSLTDNPGPANAAIAQGSNPVIRSQIVPGTEVQVVWSVFDAPPFARQVRRVALLGVTKAQE